jgi:hypothetical protein
MRLAIAAACAAISFAGAAFADGRIVATLAAPQAGHAQLIAAHAVWDCQGDTCATANAPEDTASIGDCKDLAKQVGRINSYSAQFKALDAKGLAKCNLAAPATLTATAAAR